MSTRDLVSLQSEWKEAALGSDLGLWWLAQDVRELLGPAASDEVVRSQTLQALAPLLRAGELRAVDLLPGGGFRPWAGSVDEHIARIGEEWGALAHPVSLGDIVWFVGPRTGTTT